MVLVELFRSVMERVYQQGSDTSLLRHGECPFDCIQEHGRAKMNSLRPTINCKSCKHHDRNGVRHVPSDFAGCQLVGYSAGRHGVVTEYSAILVGDHERAAGTAGLVGASPTFEPVIERDLSAFKVIEVVHGRQWLRRTQVQTHRLLGFVVQGAFNAMSRSSPGFFAGGESSNSVNCRNFSVSRAKYT